MSVTYVALRATWGIKRAQGHPPGSGADWNSTGPGAEECRLTTEPYPWGDGPAGRPHLSSAAERMGWGMRKSLLHALLAIQTGDGTAAEAPRPPGSGT